MKFIKEDKNRRQFLVGAGGTLLAIPFLPSLSSALAQETEERIKRFISIGMRNGYIGTYFHPQNIPAASFTKIGDRAYRAPLVDDLSIMLSGIFNDLKDEMMICKNVDILTATDHQRHSILMGQHFGNSAGFFLPVADRRHSIDHYIAEAIYPEGRDPTIVCMGVAWNYYYNGQISGVSNSHRISANGDLVSNTAYGDPQTIWDLLFGNSAVTVDQQIKLKGAKLSIADKVKYSFDQLTKSSVISGEDKLKLQAHLEEINELEKRITNRQIQVCSLPARPGSSYHGSSEDYFSSLRLMIDLTVMAMKCDIMRVANFEIAPDTILRGLERFGTGHHDISHSDRVDMWKLMDAEFFEHIHYLVSSLKTEGLLNDTLVMLGNEIGSQNSGGQGTVETPSIDGNHACYDMMAMTFGMKDTVQAGHYFKFDVGTNRGGRWNNKQGIAYNEWLITVMAAMGVDKSAYEQGRTGYGDYRGDTWGLCNPDVISPADRRGKPVAELLKIS